MYLEQRKHFVKCIHEYPIFPKVETKNENMKTNENDTCMT